MPDLFVVFRVAFFSGFVSCGLAVLRGTRFHAFPTIYTAAFFCGGIFYYFNRLGLPFTGGFMATAVVCIIVRIFHAMGRHGYLFIIIPCIYCITPGSALYRMFLAFFHLNWPEFIFQLSYSAKVCLGCWLAMVLVTRMGDLLIKTKVSEEKYI